MERAFDLTWGEDVDSASSHTANSREVISSRWASFFHVYNGERSPFVADS